jgi:ParB-like chromosome segregation protein Spo0J
MFHFQKDKSREILLGEALGQALQGPGRGREVMRVMELPLSKIRTSLAYLKGTDPVRRRVPLDLEEPVTVMEVSPGVFELVDGFKRLSALQRRGSVNVMVLVRDGDLLKAKALMLGLNVRRKTLSFYEEAVLAADLHREEKLTLMAVGKVLGRKKSWVSRRVGIVTRLDADIIEFLKAGEIGPTVAYHLSRLSRGLQMPLFLSSREERLTAHEVEAAVSLTLALPEAERRAAVQEPRAHLSPQEEKPAARDSGLEAVERLIRDAGRVREQLKAPSREGRTDAEKRVYRAALRRLGHELAGLQQMLDEVSLTERRNHEEQGGSGENRPGHGREGEIPPSNLTGPGHGEEAPAPHPLMALTRDSRLETWDGVPFPLPPYTYAFPFSFPEARGEGYAP